MNSTTFALSSHRSAYVLPLLLVLALLASLAPTRASSTSTLTPEELQVPFAVGPIKPDPTRNLVYVVDATYNRLLAFSTATGVQVASATINDGTTEGDIAISVDDSTLYLSESNQKEILVFSLPNLTQTAALSLSFNPGTIAAGTGGRLYAAKPGANANINPIVEVSTTDGSVLQTFGLSERYYYLPLLRTNAAGTNLYAATPSLSGGGDLYMYNISGATASSATDYPYDEANLEDFEVDETYGSAYLMQEGVYGIDQLNLSTDIATKWPFINPYASAVSYNQSSSFVFGATYNEIREFNRSTGAPQADWVVSSNSDDTRDIPPAGIAATVNGNLIYVREDTILDPSEAILGFLSTTGNKVTLEPSIADTITFPSTITGAPGQVATLNATDDSGLTITYRVVSGPGRIYGDTLLFTGDGTVVVSASTAGNNIFLPTTRTESIVASQQAQTLSAFPVISTQSYGVSTFAISPPTASSGLPVNIKVLSGPAFVEGDLVTLTGTGTVTLEGLQNGNLDYSPATPVTTSFAVTQGSQTIAAFAAIPSKVANTAPFTIVIPKASSGLPVTVTVQSGPATISGNKVTVTSVGTVTLAANQAGNANWLAATTVTTQFSVTPPTQKISAFPSIGTKAYTPTPFTIKAPTASSKLPVTISVLSGPATNNGNIISLTGTGTVVLAADQAGDASWAPAAEVTTSFVVTAAKQTITPFTTIPAQDLSEGSFIINPPTSNSGLPVTVTVQSGPATISGDTVTLTGAGTVVLAASQSGDSDYLPAATVITRFTVKNE